MGRVGRRMIQTTKRASDRRGADDEMRRAVRHGRGRRQCLERARAAANMASRQSDRRERQREGGRATTRRPANGRARTGCRSLHVGCHIWQLLWFGATNGVRHMAIRILGGQKVGSGYGGSTPGPLRSQRLNWICTWQMTRRDNQQSGAPVSTYRGQLGFLS